MANNNLESKQEEQKQKLSESSESMEGKIQPNVVCSCCGKEAVLAFTARDFQKTPRLVGLCAFCLSQLLRAFYKQLDEILYKLG